MIFDIDRLMVLVSEAGEAECEYQKYCREIQTKKGISPGVTIWIPSLDGSTAHRLGELSERSTQKWRELADICAIMDLDYDLLSSVAKSIQRWEREHWKDECVIEVRKDNYVGICLQQYLRNRTDGQFYKSTGRRKAWCPERKEN